MNKIQELIGQYANTRDNNIMLSIIGEMQKGERLWGAYSPVTKNHYLEYHDGIPTAFLFSELSFCDAFKEYLETKKIKIAPLECAASERVAMFSDLYRNGIEQIILDNGQTFVVIKLVDIISRPDFSSIPEDDRPLLNPELMKAANSYYQTIGTDEMNQKTQLSFMRELYEAKYLLPIVFDKEAPKGMELRQLNAGGASFDIAVLKKADGGCYIPVFTDWVELGKADRDRICTGNVVTFNDIEVFCNYGELISINPLGFNMVLDKTTVAEIKKMFSGAANKNTEKIGFFNPENVPEAMMKKLMELLGRTDGIHNAYLRGMRRGDELRYLVIIDFSGTNPAVFQSIAQQVGPLSGGRAVDLVSYNSDFGRAAADGVVPFLQRMKMS